MSLKEDLASMTVAQLKQMCKERSIKGYSKLTKDELIQAILSKANDSSKASITADPATKQILQRTSTKKMYSREDSEERIQKNPVLMDKRADLVGISTDKFAESDVAISVAKSGSKKSGGKKKRSHGNETRPLEVKTQVSKKQASKPVVSTSQEITTMKPTLAKVPEKHQPKNAPFSRPEPKLSPQAAATTRKKPANQQSQGPLKKAPSQPATQEIKEPRLQELPLGEQAYALKKLSKNIMPILKAHKQDFMRKNTKDLEKMQEMLEIEKSRFTAYQPTDKMLRNFIDESIKLINDVKEEQFNKMEQEYCTKILPGILKKNDRDIKKIVSHIGQSFSETDAARQIVEKIVKNKSPFPQSYLVTVILKKIRDKSL